MKTTQMRTGRAYLFRAWYGKGAGHHNLHWEKTQKQVG